jgi:hypothetical protein
MFVSREREKLINAIIFFSKNTKHLHKLKLFKLLNFLDFEHYRQTGRAVTGLRYSAWPMGPVPADFDTELTRPEGDLRSAISIIKVSDPTKEERFRIDFRPRAQFEKKYFSKRELRIMEELAMIFEEYRGEDMSEFSHYKELPWSKIYQNGKGKGRVIPYDLALSSQRIASGETIDSEELAYQREAVEGMI